MLGFKSFADRTRLEFADGIASVVGPNGCGKSNLSDAISWVLGEQSARMLRGERMADVIFNGTGTRPPTSMAEVTVTLVDPEYVEAVAPQATPVLSPDSDEGAALGEAPLQAGVHTVGANGQGAYPVPSHAILKHRAGEIMVTRRLFRSGESEYLMNGEICRLRDIQDLFMGTGLGPESYAIIEQGRIGQVLSSKPSDRRGIIEEAAGVSKFKTRKRLAEAKLESSRQNLARITDILEEVSKQANSLKRQASKARRYRELQGELRGRLKVVLISRLTTLEIECRRLREELAHTQGECSMATERLEELERQQKAATLRAEELEAFLTQQREALAYSDLERERLQSRVAQAQQQASNLELRVEEASNESERLQTQLDALEQESADRALQANQLRRDWDAAQEAAQKLWARQEELGIQLARLENEVEAGRQALLAAVGSAADLRNQLIQAQEMGLALDRQAARTEAEKVREEEERQRLAAELEALLAQYRHDESALAELSQSASQIGVALDGARDEEIARRAEVESLRQDFSRAVARKQALEESLARHAYSTESVRRLLTGSIPANGRHLRPRGVLADFVEVSSGYEEVVEEFLKPELDCVVVERHEEARSGIALLRSEGTGRSTFFVTQIPINGHSNGHADADIRGTRGVLAAVRDLVHVEPRLGLNGDPALPALENAYLVEDEATAERLAGKYPEGHFLTVSGEHYHHRLVSGGKGTSAGPLGMRREFRDLERFTADQGSRLGEAEATLAEVAARASRLDEALHSLTAAKLEAEKNAALANEKLRQVREAHHRASERLGVLGGEQAALESERNTLRARQANLRALLETATRAQTQREEEIARATLRVRQLRAQLDQQAQDLVEAQARSSALEERTHSIEAEQARLATQAEEVRARRARLAEQIEAWRSEQRQWAEEREGIEGRLTEFEVAQQARRERLSGLEQESRAVRAERDELRPSILAARAEFEAHREKRSETEVALARAESEYTHHAQQCREELSAEPTALLAELPPGGILAGENLQAAEEELRELKARLENLGPVNMMALEELQEAEERFAFLETQRQDLLASIEDTTQAIREIDQVSRQQFLEAFQAINGYFAESFRTLFGGGVGSMRLTDEADPDGGLDIVAQPPGKRLQNVLLLSGGEKALAALALLIALFRYTPSPFCVLDEVDAPLDESNVDRFTRLIQQMSRHTQFILITHNKRTMEIAPILYGVTMQEPGVSKMVSVRFDEAAREPVAVPA